MSDAAVDVLMTVYNGADYVGQAVASLQAQTFADFRLQVVDDGSTDSTAAILACLASEDPRIHIHHKPNGGVVEASNYGLLFCTAEFVARFDADDLAYPDRLAHQVRYLREHPEVLAIAGTARHIGLLGEQQGTKAKFPPADQANAD
ncbi:MAG: glycosyltransferase family 2 protein, partial [Caulobacteraceae bacterium]